MLPAEQGALVTAVASRSGAPPVTSGCRCGRTFMLLWRCVGARVECPVLHSLVFRDRCSLPRPPLYGLPFTGATYARDDPRCVRACRLNQSAWKFDAAKEHCSPSRAPRPHVRRIGDPPSLRAPIGTCARRMWAGPTRNTHRTRTTSRRVRCRPSERLSRQPRNCSPTTPHFIQYSVSGARDRSARPNGTHALLARRHHSCAEFLSTSTAQHRPRDRFHLLRS